MAKSKAVNTNAYIYQCMRMCICSYIPGITCNFHVRSVPPTWPPIIPHVSGVLSGVMTSLELCNFHSKLFPQRCAQPLMPVPVWPCAQMSFRCGPLVGSFLICSLSQGAAIKAKCQLLLAFSVADCPSNWNGKISAWGKKKIGSRKCRVSMLI